MNNLRILRTKTYNILRKSEKYLKTDMVYLAKGGLWLTLGQVISSIATFLLAIAFANLLPKETYGTYKYILSVAGILTIATLRGMDMATNQAAARSHEGTLIPIIKTKIYWGLLGAISSSGISLYYFINENITLAISFLVIAAFLPFMDSFNLYNSFLRGKKLFRASVIYGIIIHILATITLIITLFATNNLFIIIFAYFFSWTLLRAIFFFLTLKKFPPNQSIDPNTIPYGKHLSFINATAALVGSLDFILVFHYLGAVALAVYSFALAPVLQFRGLFDKLPILAIPKLANRPSSEISLMLRKRFVMLFIAGMVLSLIYIAIAPLVFKILFPKYLESVLFSQIFSMSIAITLAQSILGAATTSKVTLIPKKLLYLWNIPGIVLTLSIIVLIKPFGIMGVVISRLLSLISGVVINLIIWRKIRSLENTQSQEN